ncbi:hypothetical protein EDD11_007885 [Mortierella claussenii]|nr:hypothetical protein EDD11_007885 [Mortierella claussenii]
MFGGLGNGLTRLIKRGNDSDDDSENRFVVGGPGSDAYMASECKLYCVPDLQPAIIDNTEESTGDIVLDDVVEERNMEDSTFILGKVRVIPIEDARKSDATDGIEIVTPMPKAVYLEEEGKAQEPVVDDASQQPIPTIVDSNRIDLEPAGPKVHVVERPLLASQLVDGAESETEARARRWYLQHIKMGVIGKQGITEQPSIVIEAGQNWQGKTCRTISGYDEMRRIEPGTATRLRLHRQIEIIPRGLIELSINLRTSSGSPCELHYVELDFGQTESADLVLYGEIRPQHIISVGHVKGQTPTKTIPVHSYEVSSTGSHAVTLCFGDGGHAIIEVWPLPDVDVKKKPVAESFQEHTVPLARGLIQTSSTSHPDSMDIRMSISSSGSLITVHSIETSMNAISCHIFALSSSATVDRKAEAQPSTLDEMEVCKGLRGFYGHAKFHTFPVNETDNEMKERYVTCEGTTLAIYDIHGGWSLLSTLTLAVERNLEAALGFILSVRGRYFAWTGDRGVVSIWDLTTRKQISYIQVESSMMGCYASLSKDGSMVAISMKGCISVHETISGVKLGDYIDGLGEDKQFEVVLEQEHFMMVDQMPPKGTDSQIIERKIISTRDMSTVRTYPIHKDYCLNFPSPPNNQVFVYQQGSVVNIIKMDSDVINAPGTPIFRDRLMIKAPIEQFTHSVTQEYTSRFHTTFTMNTSVAVVHGNRLTVATLARKDANTERPTLSSSSSSRSSPTNTSPKITTPGSKTLSIPLGSSHVVYSSIFLAASSRLILVTGRYLQIWKLIPSTDTDSTEVAELELFWALEGDETYKYRITDLCIRKVSAGITDTEGTQFVLELQPAMWYRRLRQLPLDSMHSTIQNVSVPISKMDTLSITEEYRVLHGIRGAVDMYVDGDETCQKAVVEYLKKLVRPSPQNPRSCIVTLCHFWTPEERVYFEKILKALLLPSKITWIPDINTSVLSKRQDPLAILMETARTQPSAIGVAKIIMDYCASHANSSRNLSFLTPIFGSMREMMTMFPEEAFECLGQIAFIPAKQRSYIIDNHLIAHPPKFRLQFWKKTEHLPLSRTVDPIMQLHLSASKSNPSNDRFTHPVFMASFDALWFYYGNAKDKDADWGQEEEKMDEKGGDAKASGEEGLISAKTAAAATASSAGAAKTTWWKSLYYMILIKLYLRSRMYVTCYDFNLDFFDNPAIAALVDNNPAIAALVEYKWNTMGFSYWLARFVPQCVYYLLVVAAALLQVYPANPLVEDTYQRYLRELTGIFIAIILMASVFAWLEIIQAFPELAKYTSSSYNGLDLLAFIVPMAASIDQLVVYKQNGRYGNNRLLSFSVLIVFLHMLFELRINQMVCKYVSIIQQAIVEIQVFFIIFAGGILAFTIALMHLLHACPVEGCPEEGQSGTTLTKNFFGALSATYFMMGGRYDPISEKFSTEDWAFHILVIIFFFFTVILMLNVLIALINVAFGKGDDGWRSAWIESRLRYIESAENMSYYIPGYRQTHRCFPKDIYFTATPQEVRAYQDKLKEYAKLTGRGSTDSIGGDNRLADERVKDLKRQLVLQQTQMGLQELKDLLLESGR